MAAKKADIKRGQHRDAFEKCDHNVNGKVLMTDEAITAGGTAAITDDLQAAERLKDACQRMQAELGRVIVGQPVCVLVPVGVRMPTLSLASAPLPLMTPP